MKSILFSLAALFIIGECDGYDLIEGFAALSTPCFGTIHDEGCHTSLPEVFTTTYKGVNFNAPTTMMFLFTRTNQQKAEPLHSCGGKLPPKSTFDPNAETVVIVHGYIDGVCRTAWMREMRNQFFIRGNYNVILVDYTWGNSLDLSDGETNAVLVGEQIAFVLYNIMREKKLDGSKFHLIGHSLGCLVVSYAGGFLIKWDESKKLRRITLLDLPSIPLKSGPMDLKVSKNNAHFVDIIHTNAGDCIPIFIGTFQTLGHLDFFPNGGVSQTTSCIPYALVSLLKGDIFYSALSLTLDQFCSHLQSIQFFKVSINHPDGLYVGVRCDSYEDFQSGACKRCCDEDPSNCAVAGMDAEYYYTKSKTQGNHSRYYFNTYNQCPFPEDYDFSSKKDCKKMKSSHERKKMNPHLQRIASPSSCGNHTIGKMIQQQKEKIKK